MFAKLFDRYRYILMALPSGAILFGLGISLGTRPVAVLLAIFGLVMTTLDIFVKQIGYLIMLKEFWYDTAR